MYDELARQIEMPEWCDYGSRYSDLYIHELWLQGKFYQAVGGKCFVTENDSNGNAIKMMHRRPSVNLQLPILQADITSRKLFAGKHAPRFVHDKDPVNQSIKWLLKKSKLKLQMLDAAFWGQGGSSALTFKIVAGRPIATVWPARYCWPQFNDAEQLEQLRLCYKVTGSQFLKLGVLTDCHSKEVVPNAYYWYIRIFDRQSIVSMIPIPYADWNPVSGDDSLLFIDKQYTAIHKLGFVPALWMRNMPGGCGYDGRSTFAACLPNAVKLDFTLSQLGSGIDYAARPRLMVKGRILNFDSATGGVKTLDPMAVLQLAADRKNADNSATSGADAKFVEVNGNIIDIAMESWVVKVKQFTHELMALNRKDPNTIDGAMSGKAMELIDEEFLDLIEVEKSTYGDEGIHEAAITLSAMCEIAKIPQFKARAEDVEESELEWPKMYTASPQETNFMAQALSTAIKRPGTPAKAPGKDGKGGAPATPDTGWMEEEEALILWNNTIDMRSHISNVYETNSKGEKRAPDLQPSDDLANVLMPEAE